MAATRVAFGVVLVALVFLSSSAHSAPQEVSATLLWDGCAGSGIARKDFAGPAVYRLVLSAKGLTQSFTGFEMEVSVETMWASCYTKPDFPDAWRFEPSRCQSGRIQVSAAGGSPVCTGLLAGHRVDVVDVSSDPDPYQSETIAIHLASTFDPVQPNPVNQYALATLLIDHTRSVVGPTNDPTLCGGAELGMCFQFGESTMTLTGGGTISLPIYPFTPPAWQSEPAPGCGYCDPTEQTTWGRMKNFYR